MTDKPSNALIRLLVVDDQQLIRDGIASLLGLQPDIEVVGTAANGRAAIDLALETRPDVVLMDVRMPVLDGVAAVGAIRAQLPQCHVLMLTTFDDEAPILEALRAGASGYLLKDMPIEGLANAIRSASAGLLPLDPVAAQTLVQAARRPVNPVNTGPAVDLAALTDREREVLALVATGATNREIGAKLYLSEGTVKNHISALLGRLGLRDRTQLALYARDQGLA